MSNSSFQMAIILSNTFSIIWPNATETHWYFYPCLYQSFSGDYLISDDPLPPVASVRCDTDDLHLDGHQGDHDEGPPRTLTREGKMSTIKMGQTMHRKNYSLDYLGDSRY